MSVEYLFLKHSGFRTQLRSLRLIFCLQFSMAKKNVCPKLSIIIASLCIIQILKTDIDLIDCSNNGYTSDCKCLATNPKLLVKCTVSATGNTYQLNIGKIQCTDYIDSSGAEQFSLEAVTYAPVTGNSISISLYDLELTNILPLVRAVLSLSFQIISFRIRNVNIDAEMIISALKTFQETIMSLVIEEQKLINQQNVLDLSKINFHALLRLEIRKNQFGVQLPSYMILDKFVANSQRITNDHFVLFLQKLVPRVRRKY